MSPLSTFVGLAVCLSFAMAAVEAAVPTKRQAQPNSPCELDTDCNPLGLGNQTIPSRFVECQNEICVCSSCFMRNDTSNRCYIDPPCTEYNNDTLECVDNRKKTLTPFLLTFFLVFTGAANFYIDRLEFAIPQLILGIIYIFMSCCVMPCVRACGKKAREDNDTGKGCLACLLSIPYCLLSLLFFSWWIADIVIFATNQRKDGDGCPLINNL